MARHIKTNGDLMDMVNSTGNNNAKKLLRDAFQTWCKKEKKTAFSAVSIRTWRNTPVDTELLAKVVTA